MLTASQSFPRCDFFIDATHSARPCTTRPPIRSSAFERCSPRCDLSSMMRPAPNGPPIVLPPHFLKGRMYLNSCRSVERSRARKTNNQAGGTFRIEGARTEPSREEDRQRTTRRPKILTLRTLHALTRRFVSSQTVLSTFHGLVNDTMANSTFTDPNRRDFICIYLFGRKSSSLSAGLQVSMHKALMSFLYWQKLVLILAAIIGSSEFGI